MSDLEGKDNKNRDAAKKQRDKIQREHVGTLKGYMNQAFEFNKESIQHVIDMYQDKKIPNVKTALNVAKLLASKKNNVILSKRPEKEYKKLTSKYEGKKDYHLDMIFYSQVSEIEGKVGEEARKAEQERANETRGKCFKGLRQINRSQFTVNLEYDQWKNLNVFLAKWKHKLITKGIHIYQKLGYNIPHFEMVDAFQSMVNILRNDEGFKAFWENHGVSYVVGMYIKDWEEIDTSSIAAVNPLQQAFRNTEHISILNKYISTELDMSKTGNKEAIERNNYVQNECWINTLYDFYSDSLLSLDKKRNVITRSMILEVIGKTEDNIKQGLKLDDMEPFGFLI